MNKLSLHTLLAVVLLSAPLGAMKIKLKKKVIPSPVLPRQDTIGSEEELTSDDEALSESYDESSEEDSSNFVNDTAKRLNTIALRRKDTSVSDDEDSSEYYDDSSCQEPSTAEEDSSEDVAITVLPRAHFTPRIRDLIKVLISRETEGISTAQFRFTLYDVAQVWADQLKEKNLEGTIIVDTAYWKNCCKALKLMSDNGVKPLIVRKKRALKSRYKTTGGADNELMHNKLWIFHDNIEGKTVVLAGSHNATGQSSDCNWENVLIIDDAESVEKYIEYFDLLLEHTSPISQKALSYVKIQSSFTKKLNGIGVAKQPLKWKDEELRLAPTEIFEGSSFPQVLFSPDIREFICSLISHEEEGITGAMYQFTLEDVARAWAKQHKKKDLESSLYLDDRYPQEMLDALRILSKAGISLHSVTKTRVVTSPYKAKNGSFQDTHHKFYIFTNNKEGRAVLVTGSYNSTGHANEFSWENVYATDDPATIADYLAELEELKGYAEEIAVSRKDVEKSHRNYGKRVEEKRRINGKRITRTRTPLRKSPTST